jgi:hypothetical protein
VPHSCRSATPRTGERGHPDVFQCPMTSGPVGFGFMERAELIRKWRRIEVGNSIAGVLVSVGAVLILPSVVAALVAAFMAICVSYSWFLGSRLKRTGQLLRARGR